VQSASQRNRTGLYLLGCVGAIVLLSCAAVFGAGSGYLAWQVWREIAPTLTATALETPTPNAQLSGRANPSPTARPTTPTPTPRPTATPQPTPTPVEAQGPAVIPDWPEYHDPGYIRFQYPPNWVLVTAVEDPQRGIPNCHCYWILASPGISVTPPTSDAVQGLFNSRSLADLPEQSVYLEILRLDSEYAPALTFTETSGRSTTDPSTGSTWIVDEQGQLIAVRLKDPLTIGGQYSAEHYVLSEQGEIRAFLYRDQQGRPWVIVARASSGFDEQIPDVRRLFGILLTLDHQ